MYAKEVFLRKDTYMKKKISLLLALIFMLVLSSVLTSCLAGFDVPGLEFPEITPTPPSSQEPDDPGETPEEPEETPEQPPEVEDRIIAVEYLYNNDQLFIQSISTKDGFTEEKINERDRKILSDFGYKFEFYSDASFTTPYDFSADEIPGQRIYCYRDITKAGDNITWAREGSVIKFTGTGEMYPFADQGKVPWDQYRAIITSAVIPEGITSIANYAFTNCISMTEPIDLPESLRKIGANAFAATSLTEVHFPDGLVEISKNAFMDCEKIEHIKFNESLNNIGAGAFGNCTGLRSIVLNEYVLDIGSSAFNDCKTLSSVYYMGTEAQFNAMGKGFRNFEIGRLSQTWYFAENKPSEPGPYWHYDENGEIVQWAYAIWYIDKNNPNVAINLKDYSDPQGTPDLLVDFVDIEAGFTQANVDYMNSIVYHGYKFSGFRLEENKDTEPYTIEVGTRLESDIRLVGIRGNICGDNLKYSLSKAILKISKIDSSNPDAAMWDFENIIDAPWYGKPVNTIEIVDGVSYIGKNAFCSINQDSNPYIAIPYIKIPVSVKEVSPDAFSGNNGLLYVLYMGNPTQLYGDEKNGIAPEITGLLDVDLINTTSVICGKVYANATGIADLTTLGEGSYWKEITASGGSSDKSVITWSFDKASGHLTLGGLKFTSSGSVNGELIDYANKSDRPWNHYGDPLNTLTADYEIKTVAILDNVYVVGDLTVADFDSITDITMSNRVNYAYLISGTAFTGTEFYNAQYTGNGTVKITFANNNAHIIAINPANINSSLYSLPDGTISVADGAFNGCSGITVLVIAKNIANDIAPTAFEGLTALTTIYFSGNETEWASYANGATPSDDVMNDATVYFYSVYQPSDSSGNYWHYDNEQRPVIW